MSSKDQIFAIVGDLPPLCGEYDDVCPLDEERFSDRPPLEEIEDTLERVVVLGYN